MPQVVFESINHFLKRSAFWPLKSLWNFRQISVFGAKVSASES